MKQYKLYVSYPINFFMSLAAVYLLGFIGVALLCMLFIAQLFLKQEQNAADG